MSKHKFEFHGLQHSRDSCKGSFSPALPLTRSCTYAALECRFPKHRCLPTGPQLRLSTVISYTLPEGKRAHVTTRSNMQPRTGGTSTPPCSGPPSFHYSFTDLASTRRQLPTTEQDQKTRRFLSLLMRSCSSMLTATEDPRPSSQKHFGKGPVGSFVGSATLEI